MRLHLIADVPVSAFLSAGVDSGAVVGLAREAGLAQLQTITLAFEEYRSRHEDEAPLAKDVARTYATTVVQTIPLLRCPFVQGALPRGSTTGGRRPQLPDLPVIEVEGGLLACLGALERIP